MEEVINRFFDSLEDQHWSAEGLADAIRLWTSLQTSSPIPDWVDSIYGARPAGGTWVIRLMGIDLDVPEVLKVGAEFHLAIDEAVEAARFDHSGAVARAEQRMKVVQGDEARG
jgi:hypothetical protein